MQMESAEPTLCRVVMGSTGLVLARCPCSVPPLKRGSLGVSPRLENRGCAICFKTITRGNPELRLGLSSTVVRRQQQVQEEGFESMTGGGVMAAAWVEQVSRETAMSVLELLLTR